MKKIINKFMRVVASSVVMFSLATTSVQAAAPINEIKVVFDEQDHYDRFTGTLTISSDRGQARIDATGLGDLVYMHKSMIEMTPMVVPVGNVNLDLSIC